MLARTMGVKFEQSPGGLAGYTAPRFVCDTCGETIDGGFDDAIVVFPTAGDTKEPTGEFLTIHKGRKRNCDTKATRQYPWQDLDRLVHIGEASTTDNGAQRCGYAAASFRGIL